MASDDGAALTLQETASQLGVRPQRVSQLLRDGRLEGPQFSGTRAPKQAGRVWPASLAALLTERGGRRPANAEPTAGSASIPDRLSSIEQAVTALERTDALTEALVRRERAARQVAQTFKVEADVLREQLAEERVRSAELNVQLASVQLQLEQTRAANHLSEDQHAAYERAISTLLAPDSLDDI